MNTNLSSESNSDQLTFDQLTSDQLTDTEFLNFINEHDILSRAFNHFLLNNLEENGFYINTDEESLNFDNFTDDENDYLIDGDNFVNDFNSDDFINNAYLHNSNLNTSYLDNNIDSSDDEFNDIIFDDEFLNNLSSSDTDTDDSYTNESANVQTNESNNVRSQFTIRIPLILNENDVEIRHLFSQFDQFDQLNQLEQQLPTVENQRMLRNFQWIRMAGRAPRISFYGIPPFYSDLQHILSELDEYYMPNNKKKVEIDFSNWQKVNKTLTKSARNLECPISYELINKNDSYCCCAECSYNFLYEQLKQALSNKFECPMCRVKWSNETIYINEPQIQKKTVCKKIDCKKFIKQTNSVNELKKTKHNKRFYYGK